MFFTFSLRQHGTAIAVKLLSYGTLRPLLARFSKSNTSAVSIIFRCYKVDGHMQKRQPSVTPHEPIDHQIHDLSPNSFSNVEHHEYVPLTSRKAPRQRCMTCCCLIMVFLAFQKVRQRKNIGKQWVNSAKDCVFLCRRTEVRGGSS